jgi:hypothetical protein
MELETQPPLRNGLGEDAHENLRTSVSFMKEGDPSAISEKLSSSSLCN